jgi:hypothetical protein
LFSFLFVDVPSQNCHIIIGPIAGSVHLEGARYSKLVLASRQIRLHDAHHCDFYLHVLSNPIIEHCDTLRFAPHDYSPYTEFGSHLRTASLAWANDGTSVAPLGYTSPLLNNWQKIEDFNWLRVQASPNWSVLPESDRIASSTLITMTPSSSSSSSSSSTTSVPAVASS